MPIEIERKFRIMPALLPPLNDIPAATLRQGYLARASAGRMAHDSAAAGFVGATVRVRVRESSDGSTSAFLTLKGQGLRSRAEYEYTIPVSDGLELLELCPVKLEKRRYFVPVAGRVWEVDRFLGTLEGLWLAELELDSADEAFELPCWIADEVTEDPRYANAALAGLSAPPDPLGV